MAALPESAFWRFSVDFYARLGVADACVALQDRDHVDVNLLLLALWLGSKGHHLTRLEGRRLAALSREWQKPVVAPLRAVRRRLKGCSELPWAEPLENWRRQLGAVELAMEQVEQLLLERAVGVTADGPSDTDVSRANLTALGLARVLGTAELKLLMDNAERPEATAA